MPTVAEQLRRAREEQTLTISQAADITKIKADHLRALEEGRYEVFAAPVYIRGFVRTYAQLVRLELPPLLAQLDAELAAEPRFRESPNAYGVRRGPVDFAMLQLSKVNWNIALPVLAVLVLAGVSIFGFRVWQTHKTADPLAGLGPGLYEPAQKPAGEFLPLPTNAPAKK